MDKDIKDLKKLTDEELMETYKYYKPRAKRLGKDEYKYLVAIEREMGMREIKRRSIKEKLLNSKGIWVVTLEDKSKWVIDLDNNMFDSYKWYKKEGTLESELNNIDDFLKGSWKKLK